MNWVKKMNYLLGLKNKYLGYNSFNKICELMMQKQQIELEIVETERALEELSKTTTSDSIYKAAGPLLIKSEKDTVEKELT